MKTAKIVVFLFLILAPWGLCTTLTQPLDLKITTCDVGQGDGMILQYGGFVMVVDTGPKLDILACLQRRGIFRKIDVLLLTHNDSDHIGGAAEVLKRYSVRELWWNGPAAENEASGNVSEQKIQENLKKAQVIRVSRGGESLVLPGMRLRVLWSRQVRSKVLPGKAESDKNADSVAIYVESESFGFLSLGDLECAQELAVASSGLLNRVDLLKISHHGSKTSSCPEFLAKVAPEAAIISVGSGNSYGHPSSEVLKNLAYQGSLVFRTDRQGDLTFQIGSREAKPLTRVWSQK